MADAARAARGSFNDIKSGAGEMGRSVSGSMRESREGIMLLGEEFGVHLPRALTTFLAELGPIGAAMETAFPFLALIALAAIFIEHLAKMKEEGEKLTASQLAFGAVTANVLNALDDKLLQAGIRADELSGNHLAALEKTLTLIDHQSLKELEQSFAELDKASDAVMAQLKAHWYEFGSGSEGAKHALDEFKQKYDLLLAQGKDKDASDLLAGTLKSAQRILDLQKQAKADNSSTSTSGNLHEELIQHMAKMAELKKAGTGISDKEVAAQQTIVDALQAQVTAEQKVHDLKAAQQDNAHSDTDKAVGEDEDKKIRAQAQERQRAQEEQDKLDEQNYKEAVARIQEAEALKIKATKEGSQARLAAIDAAIKDENSKGLQATDYYRNLLSQRVDTARQFSEEQKKLAADAAKEQVDHTEKMGELQVAADREAQAVALETKKKGNAAIIQSELELAEKEFQVKKKGFESDIAALDKTAADYENKLKAFQDREAELVKAHENEITRIKDDAQKQQDKDLKTAYQHMTDEISHSLTDVMMRHQSFASMINSIGSEVVSGMLQNAIKSIMADDMTKEHDAARAARLMFKAGASFPFPANIIAAPTLAAGAFAAVMAFAEGGLVPGVGIGDTQPAMLTPGETVLPKKMTEQLQRASNSDDSGQHVHVHHTSHFTVHAIDGASVKGMLDKHADEFSKHFHAQLRKMNR